MRSTSGFRRIFCGLAALALAPPILQATTIVVLRTESGLVIAADSRTTHRVGGRVVDERLTCKIHVVGDVVVVAAGRTAIGENADALVLDVAAAARQTLTRRGTLAQRVDQFDRALRAQLSQVAPLLTAADAERLFLEIVLAGPGEAGPTYYLRRFAVTGSGDRRRAVRQDDTSCDACQNPVAVLGFGDTIQTALARLAPDRRPPVRWTPEHARELVELEIAGVPEWVGPPVDIVQLDADGPRWIARKPACRT